MIKSILITFEVNLIIVAQSRYLQSIEKVDISLNPTTLKSIFNMMLLVLVELHANKITNIVKYR